MNLKKSIYFYKIGKKSKKGLFQIFSIIGIFLIIIPTGVSTYDNISNNLKVPSYLEIGDLLFCDIDQDFINFIQSIGFKIPYVYIVPGMFNDHVAMYIGNDMFIEAITYHSNSENGKLYGVVTSSIGLIKLWSKNIKYAKIVDASVEQKQKAVEWALTQLGQPYQSKYINKNYNPYDNKDLYSNEWYCTELIWAAYKNQGIDLDQNQKGIISIFELIDNKQVIFYDQQVKENSKVNLDLNLALMCFLDLQNDKQNL
jgi:hypothetical protein